MRILLAEDNAVNQKIAQAQLLRLGHSIQLACDGHDAVTACRNARFDVILMDNQMPNLSGIDAHLAKPFLLADLARVLSDVGPHAPARDSHSPEVKEPAQVSAR